MLQEYEYEVRHLYFGYGMNTNRDQMASRCPDSKLIGAAILPGYKFVFRGHADVELDWESQVEGVLWEVSDNDLIALDRLEGFPSYYLRQRAWVESQDGYGVAWVYMMNDQDYISNPSKSYYDLCFEGYTQHGVPTEQLTKALNGDINQFTSENWDYFNDQQDWSGSNWSNNRKYLW
jgi:gamma-glutamylcyclotransferase (GGCT)/AIG2-like uncharacterized protein YtfP